MSNKTSVELPSIESMHSFREKVTQWFDSNHRDYPWRNTRDPFRVLIAEMMLRRTRADQVKEVYDKLFAEYPDAKSMAEAPDSKLENILYSLGLKWRTPAFSLVAREIKKRYECKVPETRRELTTLPGVGDYVAGAVLSIAFGKEEWMVDSNIVRVFRRYFGVKTSAEGRRDRHIIDMARMYVSGSNPRRANLAILDFAALVCIPSNPGCEECPLMEGCKTASAR